MNVHYHGRYSNIYLPCRGTPRYPTRLITLAALLNWTSDNASAETAMSRPITILAWCLVLKGQRPTQNKYPNLLVHWGLAERSRESR